MKDEITVQINLEPPESCKCCLFLIRMEQAVKEQDAEIRRLRAMLDEERARPDKMEDH